MTNGSEHSPVVLVFLLSPDPVLCLFPKSTHTSPNWLPAPGQPVGRPTLGVPLWAAGNATLSCSGSSGCAEPSTGTSAPLRIPLLYPTGCRGSLSRHPFGGYSCAGCDEDIAPSSRLQGRGSSTRLLLASAWTSLFLCRIVLRGPGRASLPRASSFVSSEFPKPLHCSVPHHSSLCGMLCPDTP